MLKDAPLDVALLPKLAVPIDSGRSEFFDQKSSRLVKQIETVAEFSTG